MIRNKSACMYTYKIENKESFGLQVTDIEKDVQIIVLLINKRFTFHNQIFAMTEGEGDRLLPNQMDTPPKY